MDTDTLGPELCGKNVNPNVNCLHGKRCPECGSYGPFDIAVSMQVRLYDTGCNDAADGTVEYDDGSTATCCNCRYEAKFGDFDER
jgi:hypothetical protein